MSARRLSTVIIRMLRSAGGRPVESAGGAVAASAVATTTGDASAAGVWAGGGVSGACATAGAGCGAGGGAGARGGVRLQAVIAASARETERERAFMRGRDGSMPEARTKGEPSGARGDTVQGTGDEVRAKRAGVARAAGSDRGCRGAWGDASGGCAWVRPGRAGTVDRWWRG